MTPRNGLLAACMAFMPLFLACVQKAQSPPLSDDKTARMMADFSIAEAATNGLNGFKKDSLMLVYFNQVLEMHGVSKDVYEQNLSLLAKDMPRLERVVIKAEELVGGGKAPEK